MTDAAMCRAMGWNPGSVLENVEHPEQRILITAIGLDLVLGRRLGEGAEEVVRLAEGRWRLAGYAPF